MLKYKGYAKTMQKEKQIVSFHQREGSGESPWKNGLRAAVCVAWDDRDGCSRYRAAKMSVIGRIRVVPRVFLAPILGAGFFTVHIRILFGGR